MGAGYHGGFGSTKGSAYKKTSSKKSEIRATINVRKKDIINALNGVTEMSSLIAQSIANKSIGVNILGDELFEKLLRKGDVKDTKRIKGLQIKRQMYIRRSAIDGFGIFVHEGTHAYEAYKKIPQKDISSHSGEYRAYVNEHDFQVKKGERVEFIDYDEIRIHIKLNY